MVTVMLPSSIALENMPEIVGFFQYENPAVPVCSRDDIWATKTLRSRKELSMFNRLENLRLNPDAYKSLAGINTYTDSIDKRLKALVEIRVSQINGWAESVTLISDTHAPDSVFRTLQEHFNDREIYDLTMIICVINSWNRLAISFRRTPPEI
jgi:alkylhydroperoxidase family enzyme